MKVFEGKADVEVKMVELSKKAEGFYNPEMKLNRDIAVWIVNKFKPKNILDANAASGIRSKRFLLETNTENITATDINARLLKKNLAGTRILALEKDANEIMKEKIFDYIDIDPFGSPAPFLENAINSLNKDGVIALTATDIGCLAGRFVNACVRKYNSRPMPCMFANEIGIRILLQKVITEAEKQGKHLKPIFCHAGKHYYRPYLKEANEAAEKIGFILLCRKCLNFYPDSGNSAMCCNKKMDYAGPLWLGNLFEKDIISDFGLIPEIKEEAQIDSIGYYETHCIAKKLSLPKVAKINACIDKLIQSGFKASKTHFSHNGIKTNASIKEIIKII